MTFFPTSTLAFLLCFNYVSPLNKYIGSYDTLNYRPILNRVKRDTDDSSTILRFRSNDRVFNLKLFPVNYYSNVFSADHIIDVDGIKSSNIFNRDFLYEGHLIDDPSSHVYGSIIDGVFDGHIILGDGRTFTVEKAARYFPSDKRPKNYHSIIYSDVNVKQDRFIKKRSVDQPTEHVGSCGLTKHVHESMSQFQRSQIPVTESPNNIIYDEFVSSEFFTGRKSFLSNFVAQNETILSRMYSKRAIRSAETRDIHGRKIYEVRTCSIYLQTDQRLYDHIYYKEGNRDHIRTREEIVSLLYNHIKAVNQIYEGTDFGGIRGLNFAIQRTTIYSSDTCSRGRSVGSSDNPFCEENVDVSNYLNLNSQKDHSAFCLAYALTYRDFVGGTLGLAWVASPSQSTAGGICQTHQRYNEYSRGGVSRSLNTGIITLVNYGNRVPLRVSQLTLAHEIGHNFGSPHDFPTHCQPGLPSGNFIMFASATSGDKPNNSKFSSCSVSNITEVLYEVLQQNPKYRTPGKKRNCFTDQLKSFCGNQIREPGEECDCGFSRQDCEDMGDKCCIPREETPPDMAICRRRRDASCSPSEGLCCNAASCSFYRKNEKRLCREDSECQYEQFCDGRGPECPESRPKIDGLPCQNTTKVCHLGACNGSICSQVALKDCFLTEGRPEQLCFLACEKDGVCLSSANLPELARFVQWGRESGKGLLLHPGSPCNNYKGYCDILRKCRSVDSNGPLARLKSLVLNPETISTMSQWVKENWWLCVLIGIFILMLMALFVKCCAVHTPSTNPNKPPAAHFTDTLRHPGTLLRRGQQQYRLQQHRGANLVPPSNNRNRRNGGAVTTTTNNNNHRGQPNPPVLPSTSSNILNTADSAVASASASNSHSRSSAAANSHRERALPPTIAQTTSQPPLPPPPPYQPTDPMTKPASNGGHQSASVATALPQQLPTTTSKTGAIIAPVSAHQVPASSSIPLPGAPLPAQSSTHPLIPGPPVPGHGPKPGRRRPKTGQTKRKGAVAGSEESSAVNAASSSDQKKLNKRTTK